MRILVIIRAADQSTINTILKGGLDPDGGERTFDVPLFTPGTHAPTHYWCCAEVSAEVRAEVSQLQLAFPLSEVLEYDLETQPNFPEEQLIRLNLLQHESNV